eukprot:825591-Rhodomonas_salina.1
MEHASCSRVRALAEERGPGACRRRRRRGGGGQVRFGIHAGIRLSARSAEEAGDGPLTHARGQRH